MPTAPGTFVPFGGGAHVRPGRVVSKHIAFVAIAVLLGNFDVEFENLVDENGKAMEAFPAPKRESLPGSGIHPPEGDMVVRFQRAFEKTI